MTNLTVATVEAALTSPETLTPAQKAEIRIAAIREKANKAADRLRERLEKAELRAKEAEGKDERTTEAKRLVAEVVATEAARRRCLCGCGANTPRAFFVPGHDARLLAVTVRELIAG